MRRHFAALVATCVHVAIVSNQISGEESLIGWKGETHVPDAVPTQRKWIEHISWHPRAFLYHGLVSKTTTDHIIRMAAPFMKKSTLGDKKGNLVVHASVRSSLGTFLWRLQDPVITELQRQVASWTGIPAHHQETIQVLRYVKDQMYVPHMDVRPGDNRRIATVLIYLSDVDSGGETVFPTGAEWANPKAGSIKDSTASECAKGKVNVSPKRGDALLFFSVSTSGETDMSATHGSCPVMSGTKWVATIWIHEKPRELDHFKPFNWSAAHDPADCYDLEPENCARFVKLGYCESNPVFMFAKGRAAFGYVGKCRKSCGVCRECRHGDLGCRLKNRERSGFVNFEEPLHGISLAGLAGAGVIRMGSSACAVATFAAAVALFITW